MGGGLEGRREPVLVPGVLLCAGIHAVSRSGDPWEGSDGSSWGSLELDVGVTAPASPEALGRR